MEKINNVILGSGIAGLVYAYYNPGLIIGDKVGGQFASQFSLGPRYLHHTVYSELFLRDLKMPIKPIIIRTGYQTDDGKVVSELPDEKYRKKYFMKSRGQKTLEGYDETVMSENKNSFQALEVNFGEVISKLYKSLEDRIITDKVISIRTKDKFIQLESGKVINYENVVNTIPLNVFAKLIDEPSFPKPEAFRCSPMSYVWLKPQEFKGFNYVYVAQDNLPHHRLTWDERGMVAEWFGAHTKVECNERFGEDFIDVNVLWNAQIIEFDGELKLPCVKFIGRYGTFKRVWKTEMVIEEAIKNMMTELSSNNGEIK